MPRHRTVLDLTLKSVSDNEIESVLPLGDEPTDFSEIMTPICVPQNYEFSRGVLNSGSQSTAITLYGSPNHTCTVGFRRFNRSISRSVVCDHDFSLNSNLS